MKTDPDADLRERFQRLRAHDHAAAPAFESILARPPERARRGRPGFAWTAGGAALAAAASLLVVLHLPTAAPDAAAIALPAWQSPTDFLLAAADDSLQRLSWAPSPTSRLGPPSFNTNRENR